VGYGGLARRKSPLLRQGKIVIRRRTTLQDVTLRVTILSALSITAPPVAADSQIDLGRGPVTIHVPASYDPGSPTPLAIMLHGYSGNGVTIEWFFGFATAAETAGIIYATPNGTTDSLGNRFWNATDACCNFSAPPVDDSGYLRSLVEAIQAEYNIDARRIYFAGLSNGGFMSYRMACDHADLIAAIVSVAGATFYDPNDCTPNEPVDVLEIHGTADTVILYDGGLLADVPYPGAVQSVEFWAQYDGCELTPVAPPDTLDLDINLPGSETTITRYPYGCLPGGSAELWTVHGGPHVLSGTPDFGPAIADFLLSHPKSDAAAVPAASDWGLVVLALWLFAAGTVAMRRSCKV